MTALTLRCQNPLAMPGLLFKLFGAGKLPQAIREEIAGESVLFETEGIRVTVHRRGRVPGARDAGGVSAGLGGFAVTDRRVIGSSGRGKLVDVPYGVATAGPATLTLDADGLHVRFDLDRVHPSCHGELRVEFRQPLTDAQLASFPVRELSFGVDPQKVVRLFGSLKKLPQSPD
jgi:hypothetical protein